LIPHLRVRLPRGHARMSGSIIICAALLLPNVSYAQAPAEQPFDRSLKAMSLKELMDVDAAVPLEDSIVATLLEQRA